MDTIQSQKLWPRMCIETATKLITHTHLVVIFPFKRVKCDDQFWRVDLWHDYVLIWNNKAMSQTLIIWQVNKKTFLCKYKQNDSLKKDFFNYLINLVIKGRWLEIVKCRRVSGTYSGIINTLRRIRQVHINITNNQLRWSARIVVCIIGFENKMIGQKFVDDFLDWNQNKVITQSHISKKNLTMVIIQK